jgi:hypothetical protein
LELVELVKTLIARLAQMVQILCLAWFLLLPLVAVVAAKHLER